MNNQGTKKIKCSVGILTYNSEKNLPRALESVRDFSDVIVADGGSTDRTLEIAEEYGCTIIKQLSAGESARESHHPIVDFACERNYLLENAKENWFLWLDSDEYISDLLRAEIREVVSSDSRECGAYEVPIAIQSPDAKITYRVLKQNYQVRFFDTRTGGSFKKPIHERFVFSQNRYKLGRLRGCWYVPLSKTNFIEYKRAVNHRLKLMHSANPPTTLFQYISQGICRPLRSVVGHVYRSVIVRLRFPHRDVVPLSYVRNQLYSQWVTFKVVSRLYFARLLHSRNSSVESA